MRGSLNFIAALLFCHAAVASNPARVESVAGSLNERDELIFSWKPVTGIDGYVADVSGPLGFNAITNIQISPQDRIFNIGPRAQVPAGKYYFRIRTVKGVKHSGARKGTYKLAKFVPPKSTPTPAPTAVPTPIACRNTGETIIDGSTCCAGLVENYKVFRTGNHGECYPVVCVPDGYRQLNKQCCSGLMTVELDSTNGGFNSVRACVKCVAAGQFFTNMGSVNPCCSDRKETLNLYWEKCLP